jgi:hypothetical protein
MLKLLTLPIELLRVVLYALRGLVGTLTARDRLRLSLAGGVALASASIATFALYNVVFDYTRTALAARAASHLAAPDEVVLYVHPSLQNTGFVQPLACALRRILVAPVSIRELDIPLGPELAATRGALDASKVAEKFVRATAAVGSARTFKYLLMRNDLWEARRYVYARMLEDGTRPEHGGLLSTVRIEETGADSLRDADITAQRAYKMVLRMILRGAGYTNSQGCVLGFHEGSPEDIDATSGAFCDWDRTVLAAARIIRADAGSDCPSAGQTEAASSFHVRQAYP